MLSGTMKSFCFIFHNHCTKQNITMCYKSEVLFSHFHHDIYSCYNTRIFVFVVVAAAVLVFISVFEYGGVLLFFLCSFLFSVRCFSSGFLVCGCHCLCKGKLCVCVYIYTCVCVFFFFCVVLIYIPLCRFRSLFPFLFYVCCFTLSLFMLCVPFCVVVATVFF